MIGHGRHRGSYQLVLFGPRWPPISRYGSEDASCVHLPSPHVHVSRHEAAAVQPRPRKFAHVHVCRPGGPFHTHLHNNGRHDWADAMPISGTSVRNCAEAFFRGGVRFGVPDNMISDREAQFTSDVWASLCTRLGIQHLLASAYRTQSNGLVEIFHRQLKDAFRVACSWQSFSMGENTSISPTEMVYALHSRCQGSCAVHWKQQHRG
jgi:transposase InsO family protein